MSAIAELAGILVAQGCSADVVRLIVRLVEQYADERLASYANNPTIIGGSSADVGGSSADSTYDRRKEYDRKRQAEIRRLKRLSEKPPLILTSLSSSEETLKEVSKERIRARARPKKQMGPLPENWGPGPDHYALAGELGFELKPIESRFRDYLKSHGKQYADYDAALRTFIRNTPKFNGGPHVNGQAKRGIIQAADDLCRKIASFDGPAKQDLDLRDREGPPVVGLLQNRRG